MKKLRRSDVRKGVVAVLIFLTLVFSFGCFREYYRAKEKPYTEFRTSLAKASYDKYIIVHLHEKALRLSDIILAENSISGSLLPVDGNHLFYLQTNPLGTNRYRGKEEKQVLDEVHIWLKSNVDMTEDEFAPGRQLLVYSGQVDRIEFYEEDKESTIGSHVLSVVGIGLSFAIIVALIASGSSQDSSPPPSASSADGSCPFVYAFDGQAFQLEGELFAGALLPNLERDDYLALSGNHPYDGQQVVRLKNELQEVQYINLAELIAVNHAPGLRVLPDKTGQLYSIQTLQTVRAAYTANGQSVLPLVDTADRLPFIFNEQNVENALMIHFDRPRDAQNGKLVLRAKNTQWMELMWYEFNRRYGSFYENWVSHMGNRTTESLEAWMEDQQLMLSVELLTDDGWQLVERLPFVGPVAMRDLVVPVDLSRCPDGEVQLRLRSGFLFWEVDYAGMDFSADQPLEMTVSRLLRAPANDGRDYTAALRAVDTSYLKQVKIGEQVDLYFPVVPKADDQEQTLILHSRGHYHPIREFSGLPQVTELWKFRAPDHFPRFSQDHFRAFLDEQGIRLAEESPLN